MHQTLTISDTVYEQLERTARNSGFDSIEEFIQKLIEVWHAQAEEQSQRQETVQRIDATQE